MKIDTTYKNIYLKKGKEDSLKRFHPWIFSGAISRLDEGINEGDTVRILTAEGGFAGVGHFQIGSIAARVLSFEDTKIDGLFWRERLSSALQMRQALGIADNPGNNTFRLVHGEGDNLPRSGCRLLRENCRYASPQRRHARLPA